MDTLVEHSERTGFPWLMSNVVDNETGRPLAEGKVSHVLEWWGRKIGLVSEALTLKMEIYCTWGKVYHLAHDNILLLGNTAS